MSDQNPTALIQRVVFIVILLAAIIYLVQFSIQKNAQSGQRAAQCQDQCQESGFMGYEFKWNIFSGPVCKCL